MPTAFIFGKEVPVLRTEAEIVQHLCIRYQKFGVVINGEARFFVTREEAEAVANGSTIYAPPSTNP